MRVTAILASHERRSGTLACLSSYFSQQVAGAVLDAVLVDDGSTDGTASAVEAQFPATTVLRGDGTLYWAASMAWGERIGLARAPDFVLWLNDDVVLDAGAVAGLIQVCSSQGSACIVVGAVRDPETGAIAYSGVQRRDWHPLHLDLVAPGREPVEVETFNGNVVLVPSAIARSVGPIDGAFAHAAADFDYGLRAAKVGISTLLAPGTVGTCGRDGQSRPWLDQALSLRTRLSLLLGPKGVPWRSSARYLRRHGGPLWPLFWAGTYVRFGAEAAWLAVFPQRSTRDDERTVAEGDR
jgi:GT2 family glycosyltransferase